MILCLIWNPSRLPRTADVWLRDVTAGYGERVALEHVSVAVERGSLLAVVGPNGAGKSTLLKLMAGLARPWSGDVQILGGPAGAEARRVAYVPQAELVDWAFPVTVEDVGDDGPVPSARARPPPRAPRTAGPCRTPSPRSRWTTTCAPRSAGCRAASGGACSSPGRSPPSPTCSCSTSRSPGIDVTTQELLMDLLEAQAAAGRTVVATTHDLACAAERFQQVLAVNRTVVAHGASDLVLDAKVLAAAYGGHLLMLEGRTVVLDDAHHHDDAAPGERHFHERGR